MVIIFETWTITFFFFISFVTDLRILMGKIAFFIVNKYNDYSMIIVFVVMLYARCTVRIANALI
jgi:hypothetical protein